MKRIIITFVALIIGMSSRSLLAQNSNMVQGTIRINAGLGVFPGIGAGLSGEYVLLDNLGPGYLTVGVSSGVLLKDTDSANISFLGIAARSAYGLSLIDNLDTYVGLSLGLMRKDTAFDDDYHLLDNHFRGGVFLGAAYYLTDSLGAYAELNSFACPTLTLGVSIKF